MADALLIFLPILSMDKNNEQEAIFWERHVNDLHREYIKCMSNINAFKNKFGPMYEKEFMDGMQAKRRDQWKLID
jgi:hypothetical protein